MKYLVFAVVSLSLVLTTVPFDLRNDKSNKGYTDIDLLEEILELKALGEEEADAYLTTIEAWLLQISEKDVSFYISNNDNLEAVEVSLADAQNITSLSQFNLDLETVITVHGWQNTYNSTFNDLVGAAYLNTTNVNIVAVDWDTYASQLYVKARFTVPYIGGFVGQFINNVSSAYNYSLENFSIVGHSLGAHIAGYAGQLTNSSLSSITGLDPAGPLFFNSRPAERLSEGDAQYVQAIHTNALVVGVNFAVGSADFWPNGGYIQPGCLNTSLSCSHGRSYYYYSEALNTDQFIAKSCDSYNDYVAAECKRVPQSIMGAVNTSLFGDYYLETSSSYPYALGETDL
ncbi:hypothetical protein HUJ04_012246 [Dendroctonus ponderosae]|uniref:Lipase domain-containing protein n=1 Tax=Dendroctonus ponderosae TaxID=77166 RepID=A0AAR5P1I7_DENPD|nr:hypothetical protein HUJ04_012246 [Dendroctonus ponderosae]